MFVIPAMWVEKANHSYCCLGWWFYFGFVCLFLFVCGCFVFLKHTYSQSPETSIYSLTADLQRLLAESFVPLAEPGVAIQEEIELENFNTVFLSPANKLAKAARQVTCLGWIFQGDHPASSGHSHARPMGIKTCFLAAALAWLYLRSGAMSLSPRI